MTKFLKLSKNLIHITSLRGMRFQNFSTISILLYDLYFTYITNLRGKAFQNSSTTKIFIEHRKNCTFPSPSICNNILGPPCHPRNELKGDGLQNCLKIFAKLVNICILHSLIKLQPQTSNVNKQPTRAPLNTIDLYSIYCTPAPIHEIYN